MNRLKAEFKEFLLLLRGVPGVVTALFVLSVFSMNLLANKSINLPTDWLALDCGIIVSWFAFLSMDVITKHFGPKAATEMSVFSVLVNLLFCLFFYIGSVIPGVWGESFVEGSEGIINSALNRTFGGIWYVIAGSMAAFLISSAVNNFTNYGIGRLFKRNPNGKAAFVMRTYVSTAVSQFVDNIVFALIVSHTFFGWSFVQCAVCAVTGMLTESAVEGLFAPLGFAVCKKWQRDNVGAEYFEFVAKKEAK